MKNHGAPADAEGGVEITLDSIWNSIRCLSPASIIITPNPNLFCSKLEALRSGRFQINPSTYIRSKLYTNVEMMINIEIFLSKRFFIPSSMVLLSLIHLTIASHFSSSPATPNQREPMTLQVPCSNPIMHIVESRRAAQD